MKYHYFLTVPPVRCSTMISTCVQKSLCVVQRWNVNLPGWTWMTTRVNQRQNNIRRLLKQQIMCAAKSFPLLYGAHISLNSFIECNCLWIQLLKTRWGNRIQAMRIQQATRTGSWIWNIIHLVFWWSVIMLWKLTYQCLYRNVCCTIAICLRWKALLSWCTTFYLALFLFLSLQWLLPESWWAAAHWLCLLNGDDHWIDMFKTDDKHLCIGSTWSMEMIIG